MRPRDNLKELINQAGSEYCRKNPKGKFLTWLGDHKSHELATQLITYQGNANTKDEWLFLLDAYLQNKTPRASLAKEIEAVFATEFEVRKIGGANGFYYELPLDAIVSDLRSKIEKKFTPVSKDNGKVEMQVLSPRGNSAG